MNYFKQNLLSILILLFLVASSFFGGAHQFGAAPAANVTTIGNPWVFSNTVTNSGAVTNSSTVANNGIVTNNAGVIQSYPNATSTTATSYTLVQGDILNFDTILFTSNISTTTLTFPATSTLSSLVPAAGDTFNQCFYAATSTQGAGLVFVAGAGWDFETASSSVAAAFLKPASILITSTNTACFRYIRKSNTDILGLVTTYLDAD